MINIFIAIVYGTQPGKTRNLKKITCATAINSLRNSLYDRVTSARGLMTINIITRLGIHV